MSGPEERRRAVELYFTTPMTTAQVVRHLGYPTKQCLERWLAKDPRHAGHMAKPIIPLETRTKAIEPVPGGMRGSGPLNCSVWTSEQSTTGSRRIARTVWRVAAQEQERRPDQQACAATKPECQGRRR